MSSATGSTKHTDVTPYYAAQVATTVLRAAGVLNEEDTIAPQAMYGNKTILRHGQSRRDGGNGIYFDGDSFAEWLNAQKTGTPGQGRTKVNVNALVNEYDTDEDPEAELNASDADKDLETAEAE